MSLNNLPEEVTEVPQHPGPDYSPLIPHNIVAQKLRKLALVSLIVVTVAAAVVIVGMLIGIAAITFTALAIYLLAMIAYVIFNHFELKKREENYKMMLVLLNDTIDNDQN